jgi:hypothetical protein
MAVKGRRQFQKTVSEERRQKTDKFAALSRRVREEKPIARFFLPHPARQRRKLLCLLSSLASVF